MPHTPHIFLSFPVASLSASESFYTALGFTPNPAFSSAESTSMRLSPSIIIILMTHEKFYSFMPHTKSLVTGRDSTEYLSCITVGSKQGVDTMLEEAARNGGKLDPTTIPEMEGGYGRSVEDPDGHIWEVVFMSDLC